MRATINTRLSAFLGLLLAAPLYAAPNQGSRQKGGHKGNHFNGPKNSTKPFSYEDLEASPDLVFHPCYGSFECALLQVPLDYTRTTPGGANASIAVIKYSSDPDEFPEYGDNWGGPILFNPGGPGGSGVGFLIESAALLAPVVGRQFSLISFDPRGVNNTLPRASCFDTPIDRQAFTANAGGRIIGSGGGEEIGETYVRGKILAELCSRGTRAEEYRHFGTPSVATDMLAINAAVWDLAGSTQPRKGLQYWGFSYGTLLGATFAHLYPEHVERMVLDGVVDTQDYYTGAARKNLVDTDKTLAAFFDYCALAGPLACAFHAATPEDIRARLAALLADVRDEPRVHSLGPADPQPDLLTWSDLKSLVFRSLYSPLNLFPVLAQFLAAVEARVPLEAALAALGLKAPLTCPAAESDPLNQQLRSAEGGASILCVDADPAVHNTTLAEFKTRVAFLREQSDAAGGYWAGLIAYCVGWKQESSLKFDLNVLYTSRNGTWAGKAPLLVIGNTADPVTPISAARSVANTFPPGAAIVATQEGPGHCSPAAPSDCMMGLVNQYFATGVVGPQRECAMQTKPFFPEEASAKRGVHKRALVDYAKIGDALYRQVTQSHTQ
ncbi:hypothetical protein DFH27DRAFT_584248 [Peziza echinospora]|nr:hypothetical protein DFH27DRAFT_584248 [Peziza echinospora]